MLKTIKRLLLGVLMAATAATISATTVFATAGTGFAWELADMNKTINQTNFILENVCSATLISVKHRLVLTNHHCVDNKISIEEKDTMLPDGTIQKTRREKRVDVELIQHSYSGSVLVGSASYMAEIVAHKQRADLALLRIKADTIPYTVESRLHDGPVTRGERVYIVGNPAMLDASVVEGIVSSVTRVFEVFWADGAKVPFYQISGGLAGGNSGGALYNNQGRLIGVPAAIARANHIGLAIQLPAIKQFLKESCYASVYDAAAPDPEKCFETKRVETEKKGK